MAPSPSAGSSPSPANPDAAPVALLNAAPDAETDAAPDPGDVVLVDAHDRVTGTMPKMDAHHTGTLHRALSVVVIRADGALLLQQRASSKYHAPDLWSNTCCTHPRLGEPVAQAALRRLQEEMGFQCPVEKAFTFTYRADLACGLVEHEYDHVFVGRASPTPTPNPAEVGDWRWALPSELESSMATTPERYTPWFLILYAHLVDAGLVPASRATASPRC